MVIRQIKFLEHYMSSAGQQRQQGRMIDVEAKKAIFMDRDGVINKVLLNNGHPFSPRKLDEFELLPNVKEVLNSFKEMGFINIIVTNQPDIARGLMKIEELNSMHTLIKKRLPIDDIYVCTHDDSDNCSCRKPKPGMLLDAAKKWGIDLNRSFLIGDTWKDMEAGKAAGCKTILIDAPYNKSVSCDYRVRDLKGAETIVMEGHK
jgi:D-glycero-D-manno-heptose 1,7-bisphosphate phosphatase